MRGVNVAFKPVVRRALTEALQRFFVAAFHLVEVSAFPHYFLNAKNLRAMRIFFRFATRMMLAMDGRPLLRFHARRQPKPEPEEVTDNGMQVERAVRRMAVQINRYACDGNVRKHQCDYDVAPPGKTEHA